MFELQLQLQEGKEFFAVSQHCCMANAEKVANSVKDNVHATKIVAMNENGSFEDIPWHERMYQP